MSEKNHKKEFLVIPIPRTEDIPEHYSENDRLMHRFLGQFLELLKAYSKKADENIALKKELEDLKKKEEGKKKCTFQLLKLSTGIDQCQDRT